jgi:hypothetical protein
MLTHNTFSHALSLSHAALVLSVVAKAKVPLVSKLAVFTRRQPRHFHRETAMHAKLIAYPRLTASKHSQLRD